MRSTPCVFRNIAGVSPGGLVAQVVRLLDEAPAMDLASQAAVDNVLTGILSACILQERFGLAA